GQGWVTFEPTPSAGVSSGAVGSSSVEFASLEAGAGAAAAAEWSRYASMAGGSLAAGVNDESKMMPAPGTGVGASFLLTVLREAGSSMGKSIASLAGFWSGLSSPYHIIAAILLAVAACFTLLR